jgi:thiosulfate/3-mercaptopyruvate sulfurtransferase
VRWRLAGPPAAESYAAGHLPGAVLVDLERDLAAPPGDGGRHPLPDAASFEASMRRLGVSAGSRVVAYDDADASAAARAWWLLRYYGHRDVRVLDGGFRAWTEAGLPLETAPVTPEPGEFTATPGGMPLLGPDGAAETARNGVLLDARAPERYRGEVEPIDPVAGHVPGAVSSPFATNVGPDGRLLDAATLRARFAERGADGTRPVGAYCGSGVTASQVVLALEVAGVEAALYAGSWSDWVRRGLPVETGG